MTTTVDVHPTRARMGRAGQVAYGVGVAGMGVLILLSVSCRPPEGRAARLLGESGVRLARRLYAVGLPLVALAHFLNVHGATVYVPAWLPMRIGWVYLTGAGHVAAGLAILFGVLP